MTHSIVEEHDADIEKMRASLSGSPPPSKPKKSKSVAASVRALEPEIRAKRAAGWTWEQIAAAMYQDETKASAIRTAYNRLPRRKKGGGKGKGAGSKPQSGGGPKGGEGDIAVAKVEARPTESYVARRDHPVPPAANAQPANIGGQVATRPAPPVFGQLTDPGFQSNLGA